MAAQEFVEATTFLGSQVIDYFKSIIDRLDRKLTTISHKPTFCLSENDYHLFNTALIKLEHSVDDLQFAYDNRAVQLGLDDLVMNINLAAYNTRNLANIYNFNKLIWQLEEIGVPSTMIKTIKKKKEDYRAEHKRDPFGMSRKWFKKISSGFSLTCQKCGFVHKDVDLIEQQMNDKQSRRNPE